MTTEDTGAFTIRPATALDAVNIAKLLKRTMGAESGSLRVNDQKVVKWVLVTLETAFVAVADMSGRIVGSIACEPRQFPWSDDVFMAEAWLCVKPSVHAEVLAVRLLAEAEKFGDYKKVPLMFRVEADDDPKDTLLSERSGYSLMGRSYMRMPHESRDSVRIQESALAT